MKTDSAMMPTNEHDILFDDASFFEQTFGKTVLKASSINANCDCSSYYSTEDDEFVDSDQIAVSAAETY